MPSLIRAIRRRKRRAMVLDVLEDGPKRVNEIANILGWKVKETNSVVTALVADGDVMKADTSMTFYGNRQSKLVGVYARAGWLDQDKRRDLKVKDLTKYHTLTIGEITIRQDDNGRYCLNDLHRAAGGENRHRPSLWIANQQTHGLIDEMIKAGIPALETVKGGDHPGTYVAKELVYAYAMWISPAFHLKVIRAYDAMVTTGPVMNPAQLTRLQLIEIAMQAEQERLALEHKVEELAPKAEALDRISDADGTMCIMVAAKNLQVPPKKLFAWMRANQWIYRRPGGSGNVAYQDKINTGLLTHKVATIQRDDGSEKVVEQVMVTGKGLARLAFELGDQDSGPYSLKVA